MSMKENSLESFWGDRLGGLVNPAQMLMVETLMEHQKVQELMKEENGLELVRQWMLGNGIPKDQVDSLVLSLELQERLRKIDPETRAIVLPIKTN